LRSTLKSSEASWGRVAGSDQDVTHIDWISEAAPSIQENRTRTMLAHGMGRSYGDSCLNDKGVLLSTKSLNKFISFDRLTGIMHCEAGLTIADILKVCLPAGWFPPVTAGTKFVTLGGAIANDIHGKNHHVAGTFGRHVLALELLRSNGETLICSPTQNTDLFKATVGGLGLTGFITRVFLQLKKVTTDRIEVETIKVKNLDDFFAKSASSDDDFEYTVTWIDCLATGSSLGRGLLMRGKHYESKDSSSLKKIDQKSLNVAVPIDMPNFLLNGTNMRLFNAAYYNRMQGDEKKSLSKIDPYFYPLDAIKNWNRLYGKRGFFQFQFVVPKHEASTVGRILEKTSSQNMGSFLVVLKEFGQIASPGMLSFPMPGYTMTLDFANQGEQTIKFIKSLESMVLKAGGRIYPAKDALMSKESFVQGYNNLTTFKQFVDPGFSSNFWRRMTEV
jgi:FAD/FMN-containing dehydrogenase